MDERLQRSETNTFIEDNVLDYRHDILSCAEMFNIRVGQGARIVQEKVKPCGMKLEMVRHVRAWEAW